VNFNSIMQASDGNYYATYPGPNYSNGAPTCPTGAYDSCGAVYRIKPDGTVTEILNFPGLGQAPVYGAQPVNLVEGPDGYLYGTTLFGGSGGATGCSSGAATGCGTFYKVALDGTNFTVLHNFTYAEGGQGSPIILGSDGNFYGTAGASNFANSTIYKLSSTGTFTLLFDFHSGAGFNVNGIWPNGVVEGTDGNFYGTTLSGGGGDNGTVYQVTPSGSATILVTFPGDGSLGTRANGGLVEGADGAFYGSMRGTSYNSLTPPLATLFRVTAAGVFSTLHTFSSASDGFYPLITPVAASDGNFYATAEGGGNAASGHCTYFLGCGTLYGVSPSGTFTDLIQFAAGATGAYPGAIIANSSGGLTGVAGGDGGSPNVVYSSFLTGGPAPPPIQITFYPASSTTATLSALPNTPVVLQWNVTNAFSDTMRVCSAFRQDAVDKIWTGVQTGTASASGFGGSVTITTPAIAGTYTYALTCGGVESGFATLTVGGSVQIDTTSLPAATVSTPYSFSYTAHGGTKPYTWALLSTPKPPAGLAIDPTSGTLDGTPLQYGVYQLNATVSDSSTPPLTNSATLQLVINSGLALASALPSAVVGEAYTQTATATGGLPPYTWQLTSGQLPTGFSFNTSTGAVYGTPTKSGQSTFAITVSDNEGTPAKVTQNYTFTTNVAPLHAIVGNPPTCTVSVVCNVPLQATGGTAPYIWSLESGSLPPGLSIDPTGAITGKPLQFGSFTFILDVKDSETPAADAGDTYQMTIYSGLEAVIPQLPDATVGVAYTAPAPVVTGGLPPYKIVVQSPAGSTVLQQFGATNGVLAGTPTVPTPPGDPYQIFYSIYDSEATPASSTGNVRELTVLPAPSPTTTALTSSSSIAGTGMQVTFTASITGSSPSGIVTFSNGTSSLGTAMVNATGNAVLTTSFGSTGVYSVTATYSGDSANASSVSSALTETIVTPSITGSIAPGSLTIKSGSSGTLVLTITPVGGYTGTINFSCGTLPAHITCSFAPASLTLALGSGPVTDTLTINTGPSLSAANSSGPAGSVIPPSLAMGLWMPGSLLLLIFRRKSRSRTSRSTGLLGLLLLVIAVIVPLTGCGSASNKAAPGTYPISVNVALSGGATQQISTTVTVQ